MVGHMFCSSPCLTHPWSLGYDLPLVLRSWMVPPCLCAEQGTSPVHWGLKKL